MKLCISTLVCPKWNLPQIVGAASAHGIAGIDFRGIGDEIDITRHPRFDAELDTTLEFLRQHHLEMPCLNTSISLVTPVATRWQSMLDECQRYAQLAARTQTRYLRVFGGAVPKDMTRDQACALAQRHLRQLIKICRPSGCQVILETHDEWATSAQILELIQEFDPGDVAVLWDIEHPYRRGESPADTAANMQRYIRHIHIKDSTRVENRNLPRLLGEGELPLADVFNAIRSINYTGWFCLETEKRWYPDSAPDPEQSIPQFAQYVRKHWTANA